MRIPQVDIAPAESFEGDGKYEATRHVYKFANGYGASVIMGAYTYGGDKDLWELAILNPEGDLDYTTPITSDVEGYLTDTEVGEYLARIAALPKS